MASIQTSEIINKLEVITEAFKDLNLNMTSQGTPSTGSNTPSLRTISESVNLNDIRKMMPVLSRENADEWFDDFEDALGGKKLLWIIKEPSTADEAANQALSTLIRRLVPESERNLLNEHRKSAANQIKALKKKWQALRPGAARQKMAEFYTYKKPDDVSIRAAHEYLRRAARTLRAKQPDLAIALRDTAVFSQLLASLPSEYRTVRDAIDSQGINTDEIEAALERLEIVEDELKESHPKDEDAHMARDRRYEKGSHRMEKSSFTRDKGRSGRRRSKSGSESSSQEVKRRSNTRQLSRRWKCILCDGNHRLQDCPDRSELDKVREKIKKQRKSKTSKRSHAYNAESASESGGDRREANDSEAYSDDGDAQAWFAANEIDREQDLIALEGKEMPSVEDHKWITDTGASSHMTGNRRLFTKLRTISTKRKVRTGGGRLDIKGIGTVRLVDANHSKINLVNVLYVPDLGVNLVSVRALCDRGLTGHINKRSMSFYHKRTLILRSMLEGNLYMVKWFTKGVEEYALTANQVDDLLGLEDDEKEREKARLERDAIKLKEDQEVYNLWHRRMCHIGPGKLRNLHEITDLRKAIPCHAKPEHCEVCDVTKMRKNSSKHLSTRKDGILDLVSIDICGPFPASVNGNRYFIECRDNRSRKGWVIPIKERTDAPSALDKWRAEVELQTNSKLKAVRIDNAGELVKEISDWQRSSGTELQQTIPYSSFQNGVAERAIQSTEGGIRAMTAEAQLPIEFWDEAATAHCYSRNRIEAPRQTFAPGETAKTPEEIFTGKPVTITHMRVWGTKTVSYVDPRSVPDSNKFTDRGRVGVFVGYIDATTKHYRIYAPDLGRVITASTVKFYENEPGGTVDLKLRTKPTPSRLPVRRPRGRPRKEQPVTASAPVGGGSTQPEKEHRGDEIDVQTEDCSQDKQSHTDQSGDKIETAPENHLENHSRPHAEQEALDTLTPSAPAVKRGRSEDQGSDEKEDKELRRSKRLRKRINYAMEYALVASRMSTLEKPDNPIPTPRSYSEAINDPVYGPEWRKAIRAEIRSLILNGTFRETRKPRGVNIVTSKWVFLVKYAPNGGVERFKARLVARGFTQIVGVDYQATFAPTIRVDSLRMLLAIIALEDMEAHQVDVNNAFTEATLKEKIYMKPPDGVDIDDGTVWELRQSLYGLKQAARDWYELCSSQLRDMGFKVIPSDPCVFINRTADVIVGLYVDDLLIAARRLHKIHDFKRELSDRFKIKDLGEAKRILGIRITRDRKNRTIYLDQSAYIKQMLRQYDMDHESVMPTHIPMASQKILSKATDGDILTSKREYQQRVGSVMFPMVYTRPDIAFSAGKLAQFMDNPTNEHARSMKTLLRYLRSTMDLRIRYGPYGPSANRILGYSDADYAGDKNDRKSTSGMIYLLGGGPISWRSRKQPAVSTSTTEAEYIAMSSSAKHAKWIAQFLTDINCSKYISKNRRTVKIYGDNQGSLKLIDQPQLNERSKHIDVAYHFTRDLSERNIIATEYIPTNRMLADGLTKPLPRETFERHRREIGLVDSGSD